MTMATNAKTVMAGLIAASALAVAGTSASAAFNPEDLGIHQAQITQASQMLGTSQAVHRAAWSDQDQRSFWEQEEDRGG
jgi:formate dehydrogenase assembly factor FdhD